MGKLERLKEKLKFVACEAIDSEEKILRDLSIKLWNNPELGFEEKYAHDLLASYLRTKGFLVDAHTPLETSFIAKMGDKGGINIGFLCEYDALPGIGHACGHNLIAEAGIAAAIGLQAVLNYNKGRSNDDILNDKETKMKGQVFAFGTPAEEGGGGKVHMIEKGCFIDMDVCMMIHPDIDNVLAPPLTAFNEIRITYHGKASHAATAPWEGINALDAAVSFYNGISMMRQQIKSSCFIHGIFTDGGQKPNIIPQRAELEYVLRAPNQTQMDILMGKFISCAKAAAIASGCEVVIETINKPFADLRTNYTLARLYEENARQQGIYFSEVCDERVGGSTDMGNVSHHKPSIHPEIKIPSLGACHTVQFAEGAKTLEAHHMILNAAKAMAMTAVDVLCDKSLLDKISNEFCQSK